MWNFKFGAASTGTAFYLIYAHSVCNNSSVADWIIALFDLNFDAHSVIEFHSLHAKVHTKLILTYA